MSEFQLLLLSAAFLGFFHTLVGPDHYVAFIVLSRARNWSSTKTFWITFISGIGHVGGSVILGIIGIAMGLSLSKLEMIESHRAGIVGWMLIAFGFLYTLYGVWKFIQKGGHFHLAHILLPKKIRHIHHLTEHAADNPDNDVTKLTPWILFLIFVFGPCEVLIPLLIFPASQYNGLGIALVSIIFGMATILTMLFMVFIGRKGVSFIQFKNGDRLFHLIAGMVILILGIGMKFLGW